MRNSKISITADINKRRSLTPSLLRQDQRSRSKRQVKLSQKTPQKELNVNPYLKQVSKHSSPNTQYQQTSKKVTPVQDKYTDWYKSKKRDTITPFAVYQNFESTPKVRRSATPKISTTQDFYSTNRQRTSQYSDSSRRAITPNVKRTHENMRASKTEHQILNARREEFKQPTSFSAGGSVVTNVNQSFGYGGLSKSFLEKISNQEFNDKDMEASFKKYLNELTNQVVHARSLGIKLKSMPFRGSTDVPFTKNSKVN